MGTFRVEIEAVGGHGCKRDAKQGDPVYGCNRMDCPDCLTRDFVQRLTRNGSGFGFKGTFTHWPGTESQVVDRFTVNERGTVEVVREKNDFFNSHPHVVAAPPARPEPVEGGGEIPALREDPDPLSK